MRIKVQELHFAYLLNDPDGFTSGSWEEECALKIKEGDQYFGPADCIELCEDPGIPVSARRAGLEYYWKGKFYSYQEGKWFLHSGDKGRADIDFPPGHIKQWHLDKILQSDIPTRYFPKYIQRLINYHNTQTMSQKIYKATQRFFFKSDKEDDEEEPT